MPSADWEGRGDKWLGNRSGAGPQFGHFRDANALAGEEVDAHRHRTGARERVQHSRNLVCPEDLAQRALNFRRGRGVNFNPARFAYADARLVKCVLEGVAEVIEQGDELNKRGHNVSVSRYAERKPSAFAGK